MLGNARRKLHPKPGSCRVQAASGRCPAGTAPERPGRGPVSGHPEGGAERQGRDFTRGVGGRPRGKAPSPGTPVVASQLGPIKMSQATTSQGLTPVGNSVRVGVRGSQASSPTPPHLARLRGGSPHPLTSLDAGGWWKCRASPGLRSRRARGFGGAPGEGQHPRR